MISGRDGADTFGAESKAETARETWNAASPRAGPRLILFDLDGTLVDHEGAAGAALSRWLLAEKWACSEELPRLLALWAAAEEQHYPAFLAGRVSYAEQRRLRLQTFLPFVGVDPATWRDDRLDEAFAGYLEAYEQSWRPYPDAEPCLAALNRSVRIAVLSNGSTAQQEDKLRRTGLSTLVERVVTSEQLGVAKPNPQAFQRVCAELGVEPGATAYVGDRLDVDARAAAAAGLTGVWLNRASVDVAEVLTVFGLHDLPSALGLDSRS